ncbi:formate dehydrogenase subunit gamma [Fuscibacter oryzae]|uniref:Formate dehydrogenase subunit gamma n=1 Tax=Fuscibacter oryzae TaxID=2803939 RepID=A0A8J7MQZ0_9RHOB|nr:formate dehydrogenase subunit gamma [Fuscibacter oryzae]MBL4928228.1 formate dehydrogenase subunit gamma [Fuscibacter oryzae]
MLDSVQTTERVAEILNRHRGMEGALLPILHAIQEEFGHVPQEALPIIAQDLNLSRAEVHGVMSFYHDFREKPAGAHVLKLCRAESCQSVGADRVADHARKELGIEWHETTKDGKITLEPVFCLGLCACGPAAIVDGKLVGRVDEAKLTKIIGGLK